MFFHRFSIILVFLLYLCRKCVICLLGNKTKTIKNRLHRLKPKGTPQGLMPSIKALRLMLALNPCGCGRFPTASNDASKKQKKVDVYFFHKQ